MLGPAGCGKTTTLRRIGGFDLPSSGTIDLRRRDITRNAPDNGPVNMVFQSYALFPHLEVAGNIALERNASIARMTDPLRIGLLLDGWLVPRWVEDIVRTLQGSTYAELVLVVLPDAVLTPERAGLLQRLWRNRRTLAFLAYEYLDARRFAQPDDPFSMRDIRSLLLGVPQLTISPIRTRYSDRFSDSSLDEIATHGLDVALRFGFRILEGGALEIARHGVWSFHHGDNRLYRGGPPATWEVLEHYPVTGALVQVLTDDLDRGRVLGRVGIATDHRSVYRNRRALYERAWPMLPRLLERLHETGQAVAETALIEERGLRTTPGTTRTLLSVGSIARHFLADRVDRLLWVERWRLAYYLGTETAAPSRFVEMTTPADRFWADPFPVEVEDGYVVFFEELIYPRRGTPARGWISALHVDHEGNVGPPRRVLEEPHHLSYPLVFAWQGEWYMLPESAAAKEVVLYRSVRFPDVWEPSAVLFDDLAGIDNTLAEIDGRWWLWVTRRPARTLGADETLLFHADSPLGPFLEHPANPVASDIRTARGAGRPFLHEGHWIRPVQDGSGGYGRAIAFMRVDRLDLTGYAETEVARIEPKWTRSVTATHTYNRAGRLQMIDFVKRRSRLRSSAR